jgi:hypothetical protein
MEKKPNGFVIVGVPRTGTTMLVNSLNNLSNVTVYGEICAVRGGKPKKKHWQPIVQKQREIKERNSFRVWAIEKYGIPQDCYDLTQRTDYPVIRLLIPEYLDDIFSRDSLVGFKLLYPHTIKLPEVVEYIKAQNISVIHLTRDNVLKTALSMKVKKDVPFSKFRVDVTDIENKVYEIIRRDKYIGSVFYGCKYMNMTYEELTLNMSTTTLPTTPTKKMLGFLGIEPQELICSIKRTSPNKISDRLLNYNELSDLVYKKLPEFSKYLD